MLKHTHTETPQGPLFTSTCLPLTAFNCGQHMHTYTHAECTNTPRWTLDRNILPLSSLSQLWLHHHLWMDTMPHTLRSTLKGGWAPGQANGSRHWSGFTCKSQRMHSLPLNTLFVFRPTLSAADCAVKKLANKIRSFKRNLIQQISVNKVVLCHVIQVFQSYSSK